MAIHIEPIVVDNVNTFTFDRYVGNLTESDVQRMQHSAQQAYEQYGNSNSMISEMVQRHVQTYSVDDALNRAKAVMESIEEVQVSNDIEYLNKDKIPKANSTMRRYLTSHPEVQRRLDNKTLTPFSVPVPKESIVNLNYKLATSGINTSSKKLQITQTTKPKLKLKDKVNINKTYKTLVKNLEEIDFE